MAWAAVCLFWGTTGPGIRVVVRSMPPFLQGGVRFVFAGALLLGVLMIRGKKLPRGWVTWRDVLLVSLLLCLANGLFSAGFLTVTGAVGTLIVSTVAIWISVLEALRPGGSKPGLKAVLGLAVGIGGVAVLLPWHTGLTLRDAAGYGLLLVAALIWSFSTVYQRHRKFSERIDPFVSAGLQLFLAGIMMCIVGLAIGELPRWNPTNEGLLALVYLTIFGSLVGYVSFIYMLEKLPADVVGIYTYINPLVAAGVDLFILREPPGTRFWAAAGLILLGVFLVQRSEREKGRI
ncbi:MAG: EamA family transporter [Deltaproteobacteria bacterium]|nr:EamA family transporter [Deltaproteobacteria bacterium]